MKTIFKLLADNTTMERYVWFMLVLIGLVCGFNLAIKAMSH